jgi:hypothetical protein
VLIPSLIQQRRPAMPMCVPRLFFMQKKRARAIAIALTRDDARIARLRLLALASGATVALCALALLF